MKLPAFLKPINILEPGADEEIKRMGELARAIVTFDLICLEHGVIAREVQEHNIQREETRHRVGEMCWHQINTRNHEVV